MQPEPLAGIRVVEMTAGVLGPMCGVYLSDMGADVIKVEPPGGDLSRYARGIENPLPLESPSPFFTAVNRGKRSVVVDATSPLGTSALHRLLATADIFLSNYRSDALARLGIDEPTLRVANERIVYAVASGFGAAGPDAGRPMVDGSGQARGGLASVTGTLEEPALAGAVVADSAGALLLALAVMTALVSRERYGVGQRVDISALGGQLWLQSWELAHASMTGFVPTAQGPHHPIFAGVYGMYRTSDDRGLFIAGIANPDDWEALCRFGGLMDVCRDPRWDTNQKRTGFDPSISYEEVNALRPRLKEAFAQRSLADWEEFLHTRPDIIFHRVQDYREVLADQQVVANGYLAEVDVFKSGPQRLVGNVVGMSVTPGSVKGGPPMLGEHTEAVLGQVGYSLAEVTAIRDEAKIGLVRKLPGMNLKPSD